MQAVWGLGPDSVVLPVMVVSAAVAARPSTATIGLVSQDSNFGCRCPKCPAFDISLHIPWRSKILRHTQSKFSCGSGICPNMALNGDKGPGTSVDGPNPAGTEGVSDTLNPFSLNAGDPEFIELIPLLNSPSVIAALCFSS